MILNRQFSLRNLISGQQLYEKMINIDNKQEKANQNSNGTTSNLLQGYYQNNEKIRIGKYTEKREPWCTFD